MADEQATVGSRFNRFTWGAKRGPLMVALILLGLTVGGTGYVAYATTTGQFFQELQPPAQHAQGDSVRRHGYGGFFLLYHGGGRSHFGGGGRIH